MHLPGHPQVDHQAPGPVPDLVLRGKCQPEELPAPPHRANFAMQERPAHRLPPVRVVAEQAGLVAHHFGDGPTHDPPSQPGGNSLNFRQFGHDSPIGRQDGDGRVHLGPHQLDQGVAGRQILGVFAR
ncbi:hypothetical protein SDC9_208708 [bioreactor metagenome]|uniref:Uncharacterized protein n=1 Tax=bioreactor metagenome TaxID=1076179 RepID=A0A645JB97_9ZZZZ